jgi:uncharacterized protein (TIGR02118 family)
VIKVVAPALRHPRNRTLPDFHHYWATSHGPLFANTKNLRRYVQHLTLPESHGAEPVPTFDGVSMFWYDELEGQRAPLTDPRARALLQGVFGFAPDDPQPHEAGTEDPQGAALLLAVLEDDAQLFDRSTSWPMHDKRASVAAEERVIVDGDTNPQMVKAIYIAAKLPGLTLGEFFDRWHNHHGPLVAKAPGLRRYVQNHAIPSAYAGRTMTHDGWSELWFDDLSALQNAVSSAEWQTVREDGATLFAYPMGVGVARELVQKDLDWSYNDWGVNDASEEEIRARLQAEGYATLAAEPDAPRRIKAAAAAEALAVWTDEHLVTIDESGIDARPER